MEIEVGDWIRSKDGFIGKVQKISYDNMEKSNYYICEKDNVMASNYLENIVKHSKNIIDLVKVGDLIKTNEEKTIIHIYDNDTLEAVKEDIKEGHFTIESIVTHEQFESIEYKVEEEVVCMEYIITSKKSSNLELLNLLNKKHKENYLRK